MPQGIHGCKRNTGNWLNLNNVFVYIFHPKEAVRYLLWVIFTFELIFVRVDLGDEKKSTLDLHWQITLLLYQLVIMHELSMDVVTKLWSTPASGPTAFCRYH